MPLRHHFHDLRSAKQVRSTTGDTAAKALPEHGDYQPDVPGSPLNEPSISAVIQPP